MEERVTLKFDEYMNYHVRIKNGWSVSIGYGFDKAGYYDFADGFVTHEELMRDLNCMSEIITLFGVPQIGAMFENYSIQDVHYNLGAKIIEIHLKS